MSVSRVGTLISRGIVGELLRMHVVPTAVVALGCLPCP